MIPTIKDRADSIYRKITLVVAAANGAPKSGLNDADLLKGIAEVCSEALTEAYIIGLQDSAKTPAPSDDQRMGIEE